MRLLRELLPRLALDVSNPAPQSLASLFPVKVSDPERQSPLAEDVWLEIGFGGAEHMIWHAKRNPAIAIIGCEPFEDGVAKALSAIEEGALENIRIHAGDARPVLRWLPAQSLARVFVLFPDPWPKTRHLKRRLVARPLLDLLARVMKPGAELRVATDIGDYARTILESVEGHDGFRWLAASPADWRERAPDWPETRYEVKATGEGRRRYFFRFIRA
jgi:tRNA (guanine-N7-)-methyltransferase